MYNVVFVHGTGVREPIFGTTFTAIKSGLGSLLPDTVFHPCYWGEHLGSNFRAGSSIPVYRQTKGIGEISLEDDPFLQWSALLDDPLIELKLIAAHGVSANIPPPPGQSPANLIRNAINKLLVNEQADSLPSLSDNDKPAFVAAIQTILAWSGLDTAIRTGVILAPSGANLLDSVRLLLARAIAAGWLVQLVDSGQVPPSAIERDALVDGCFAQLGGGQVHTKGVGNNLLKLALAPVAALLKTSMVQRKIVKESQANRHSWTSLASPKVGDILVYQARGKAIRDFIAQTVDAVGQPVILLAHSLGGVACIDLLIEQVRPMIKGVVTVGSQAPFFYEIGALSQLEYGHPLPEHMPPWLNFYDPADLLAFVGAPLMAGGKGVCDVEIASGQPFPLSHGAYWKSADMWQRVAQFMRENLS